MSRAADTHLHPAALPWSAYVDEAALGREQPTLRSAWHYVGATSQLPGGNDTGAVLPARVLDVDVVVTRDAGGDLHCLRNACMHRGATLVDTPCARHAITCPYHAWTYALDGRLRSAPRIGDVPVGTHDLPAVRLEAWGQLLFANLDAAAPPLLEFLAGVPERVAALGIDVDALAWHSGTASTTACNWKVAVENYLECYHCRVAHPGFVAAVDTHPDRYELDVAGGRISQSGARIEQPRAAGRNGTLALDTSGPVERGEFHYVFPNLVVNVAPGRPNLSLGSITPNGTGRTDRRLDYLFAPGEDPAWIDALLAWDDQVGVEDLALVEGVQRGITTAVAHERAGGPPATGSLLAHDEALVRAFHDLYAAAVPPA